MWLLDTSKFFPRSHCGVGWTDELIFLAKFSNILIFLAYTAIATILFFYWKKHKNNYPASFMINMFAAFIGFCGLTHFCNVLVFSWPAYRLFVCFDSITAIVSVITAAMLPSTIKFVSGYPSFNKLIILTNHLQEEILRRELIVLEYNQYNELLKRKVDKLENDLQSKEWLSNSYETLNELKNMLKAEQNR